MSGFAKWAAGAVAFALLGCGSVQAAPAAHRLGGGGRATTEAAAFVITTSATCPIGGVVAVMTHSSNSTGVASVVDGTNTYGLATGELTLGGAKAGLYYTAAPLAAALPSGAAITVTWASTSGNRVTTAVCLTGLHAISLDRPLAGGNGSDQDPKYTSAAPTHPDGIALAFIFVLGGQGTFLEPDPNWTSGTSDYAAIGSSILYTDWRPYSASAALTWDGGGLQTSRAWAVSVATFRAADSGVSALIGRRSLLGVGK